MRVFVPNYSFKNKNKPEPPCQQASNQPHSCASPQQRLQEGEIAQQSIDSKVSPGELANNNDRTEQLQKQVQKKTSSNNTNEEATSPSISHKTSNHNQGINTVHPDCPNFVPHRSLLSDKDSRENNIFSDPATNLAFSQTIYSGINSHSSLQPTNHQLKHRLSASPSKAANNLPDEISDEPKQNQHLKKHKLDHQGNQNHHHIKKKLSPCAAESSPSTPLVMGLERYSNGKDPSGNQKRGKNNHHSGYRLRGMGVELHSDYEQKHSTNYSSGLNEVPDNYSFQKALKKRGLEEIAQEGDGNCLFRAVSWQVYGDSDSHMDVRRRCMDFMSKEESHFSQFVVDEPFQEYILRKRQDGVHGNNPEIQAISELYNRPVEVFVPQNGASPINIFQSEYKTGDAPIRLSYHDGNHYNAVVDPLLPTAGLGLGLPGLEPGLADKLQMQRAVDESDQVFIQKATEEANNMELKSAIEESKKICSEESSLDYMYEKKKALAFSDIEETNYEIEQTILLSSLESFQRSEASRKPSGFGRDHGRHSRGGRSISPPHSRHIAHFTNRNVENGSHFLPEPSSNVASISAAASSSSAAIANQNENENEIPSHLLSLDNDEYPQTVQELVMNGFELTKVLKAYDLIGDNFDNLLAFLMSSGH